MMIKKMESKEVTTFSLKSEIRNFIEDQHWNFRLNRSEFVNKIFKYLKENPQILELIFSDSVDTTPEITPSEEIEDIFDL